MDDVTRDAAVDREARIRRALDHLRNDTTDQFEKVEAFEAFEFTDPDRAARERDLVFGAVPTIVAHGSEIAKPYEFKTLRLPRNNVIIVRQKDGSVKALVNLCRHRGALLETDSCGKRRLFSCPYHRWSYDIDGSLRAITRDNTVGDIDPAQAGLVELPCEERHGFVWVVDRAGAAIDVAGWLGPEMDEILAGYHLDGLHCVKAGVYHEDANWKILQDAFLDGYHIQYAHPNTAAKYIHTNVMAFEDFGSHCRFIAPRKSIDRWLEEDPGERSLVDDVTETHFLGPNSTLLKQPDHFQLLTFWPDPAAPEKGVMEMRLLVPSAEAAGMTQERWDYLWDKNWKILEAVLINEDFPVLRDSQWGMRSRDAAPMVLGRNEVANQVFRRLLDRLLSVADPS
ncbi:aromatic ring-hydroxylating oxygenase subunit alpha [Nocardioides daeguensis]|uniref:Aromatic ring-hydroxylating dioxygenase subunit alpha n=1 Tax=Nocardioides daeguensis TaxID=908359 RepID=A0ABP6V853_9ACTN|nr:aromatic ring-hydroxylating dioxygenase subunit alpha [Nocardioides daeguensis]MBV6726519.1 aromatic ring-hydroxylating dioxygenase subunit alpha [Nocardioides daeguensis]MCR1772362.1 aromatic ring-hydroxylating dioxygenase subunit alpha [Nocardioides daeguensis]